MTQAQVMTFLKSMVAAFGVGIAAFVAGRSSISADTIIQILNNPATLSIIASIIVWVMSVINHSDKNVAAQAAAIPGTTVITTPEIAAATPDQPNIVSNTSTPTAINSAVKETAKVNGT